MPNKTVKIDLGDKFKELRETYDVDEMGPIISEGIRRGLNRANPLVLGKVKRERFNGVGPYPVSQQRLGHDTRTLVRSLDASRARIVDVDGIDVRTSIGSNVPYFGAHEFGFEGEVKVPAHTREMPEIERTSSKGKKFTVPKHTQKVKAHKRHLKVAERQPLRAGLRDPKNQTIYLNAIGKELVKVLT